MINHLLSHLNKSNTRHYKHTKTSIANLNSPFSIPVNQELVDCLVGCEVLRVVPTWVDFPHPVSPDFPHPVSPVCGAYLGGLPTPCVPCVWCLPGWTSHTLCPLPVLPTWVDFPHPVSPLCGAYLGGLPTPCVPCVCGTSYTLCPLCVVPTWVDFPHPVSPATTTIWFCCSLSRIICLYWNIGKFSWSVRIFFSLLNCKGIRNTSDQILWWWNTSTEYSHFCVVTSEKSLIKIVCIYH